MFEWQPLAMVLLKIGFAISAGLAAYAIVYRLLATAARRIDDRILPAARYPLRAIFALLALMWVLPALSELEPPLRSMLQHVVSLGTIGMVTWLATVLINVTAATIADRQNTVGADSVSARRIRTQVAVLERTLVVVIVILGVAAALMTFPRVRQIGTTLLVSAGFTGIVVGLAARPVLENLIAGLQLGLTQPISLGDLVVVEGETGHIEEITSTYVVVKIWDERRLIVPFAHFISRPFQNWTRNSSSLLATVFLHADYRVPVQALREELMRVCEGSQLWDRRVCNLQVTDAREQALQLRALVSAANSSQAGDLAATVREQLVTYLRREYPDSLPRHRIEVIGNGPTTTSVSTTASPSPSRAHPGASEC